MSKEQSSVAKAWEATIRKTQAARRRANSIFGTMSIGHADDDNEVDRSMENLAPFVKTFCFDVGDPVKEKENEVISCDVAFSLKKNN